MATIDIKFEQRAAAPSLFEEGLRRLDSDPAGAKFFLVLVGRVYDGIEDRFQRNMVTICYKSALAKLGETPSDEPSAWYNKR